MKITKEWLQEKDACRDGYDWFYNQKETNPVKIINQLMKEDHFEYANWLIVRVMDYKQYVSYAVYAAEFVIPIFEEKNPNNNRCRQIIEAAKKCLNNPTEENKDAAGYASDAYSGAYSGAYSAAASNAASNAAYSASVSSATYAASSAVSAVEASGKKETQQKMINYGLKLLKG